MANHKRTEESNAGNYSSYEKYISSGYYSYGSHALNVKTENVTTTGARVNSQTNAKSYVRSNDSTAKALPVEKPRTAPRPKKQPEQKIKYARAPKPKIEIKTELDIQVRHRTYALSYVLLFVIGIGIFLNVNAFASNQQKELTINSASEEYNKLQVANSAVKAEIYNGYDFTEIERIASTELGMGMPQEHQIVYVDIPKMSYFVQYDDTKKTQGKDFFLAGVMDFFTGNGVNDKKTSEAGR